MERLLTSWKPTINQNKSLTNSHVSGAAITEYAQALTWQTCHVGVTVVTECVRALTWQTSHVGDAVTKCIRALT